MKALLFIALILSAIVLNAQQATTYVNRGLIKEMVQDSIIYAEPDAFRTGDSLNYLQVAVTIRKSGKAYVTIHWTLPFSEDNIATLTPVGETVSAETTYYEEYNRNVLTLVMSRQAYGDFKWSLAEYIGKHQPQLYGLSPAPTGADAETIRHSIPRTH